MVYVSRRQVLKAAVGGVAGIALGSPILRAQALPDSLKLADDLFVVRLPGEANVIAQTASDGVLLVDGGSAAGSDALLKAVAALPNGTGRIHTLFNTHWHPEQTGLNERLGMAGAAIIAQENTRLWLTQNITWPWNGRHFRKLAKVAQPNKTFYDGGKLDSGVRYGYVSDAAHTDGDMYVYFPKQNVLAAGGVVTGQGWPEIDWWTGGWIGGIVGGIQRLQTVGDAQTRIVPAAGPLLTAADLRTQIDIFGTIYDRLNQMLNKGHSPAEAVAANPTKEFDDKMGKPDEFVRRAFESLWAYLSPDA
jgi:glyoxylase-like metal-dependent hydrolase (beta-lactamase superfamily II)